MKKNLDDILKNTVIDNETLTAEEYFNVLKSKLEVADETELQNMLNSAIKLLNKYKITKQKLGAKKLYNFALLCEKELNVVKYGITEYITRNILDEYITKIASKDVVICELENYERDIPDNIVEELGKIMENNLFDKYYVVFTDYTGGERVKVEKARRKKDPILFGVHMIGNQVNTRLYYIASWEDEFCDLTLEKMIKEYAKEGKDNPVSTIKTDYSTLEDFKKEYEDNFVVETKGAWSSLYEYDK